MHVFLPFDRLPVEFYSAVTRRLSDCAQLPEGDSAALLRPVALLLNEPAFALGLYSVEFPPALLFEPLEVHLDRSGLVRWEFAKVWPGRGVYVPPLSADQLLDCRSSGDLLQPQEQALVGSGDSVSPQGVFPAVSRELHDWAANPLNASVGEMHAIWRVWASSYR